jgi:hypothetical protein
LWYLKIVNTHPDFPLIQGITAIEWKKLYYKLKYQDWTAVMVWADINNFNNLIDWILQQQEYKNFFYNKFRMYLHMTEHQRNKLKKTKVVIMLYDFFYNHKIMVRNLEVEKPLTYQLIINKLIEFIETEPELADMFKLYLKNIFNITY